MTEPEVPPTAGGSAEVSYSDRYVALGIPRPPVKLVCAGQCEGTGVVPIYHSSGDHRTDTLLAVPEDEPGEAWLALWMVAEKVDPASDGWHFVRCPECEGSGWAGAPQRWVTPEQAAEPPERTRTKRPKVSER